jgi:catechol 2,3-dioxygenase-like lactoylglutathione lyase family enzyme
MVVSNFDHMTIVVTDVDEAVTFFGHLGFALDKSVVIKGPTMDAYMGIDGLEAEHVTLVIPHSDPRQEIQLLHYHAPPVQNDADSGDLLRTGFNHVCFRVADLDAEVKRLVAAGVELRNTLMDFHSRKLVFLRGPNNVVVELAEWE